MKIRLLNNNLILITNLYYNIVYFLIFISDSKEQFEGTWEKYLSFKYEY